MRSLSRLRVAAVSSTLLLGWGLASAAPAAAAGPLPTTTTLTTTPSGTVVSGTPVTLTATVKVLGLNGLLVTPTGSVTFTSTDGTHTANLGSASVSPCLLTTCTASLTTAAIPINTVSVTGTYGGDTLAASSSGTAPLGVVANPNPGSSTTVICYAGQPCDSGTVTATDASSQLRVVADPSAGTQSVHAELQAGQTLHCPQDTDPPTGGARAEFSNTAPDAGKTVSYTGLGAVGEQMEDNYAAHPTFVGCFAADHPFKGYIGGVYTDAQPVAESFGVVFEAQLSNCANNSGQKPCFTNINGPQDLDTYRILTVPGDPKFTP